ncbi:hypothetical protein GCM10008955_10230 [Deinococcus malanensis]|uniref:DUF2382 domain-containing protein n=1 Tax=Deinococcus malanensis TaxID=1706855 RepID=A0ABQ2ENL1_9DEIO|nr:DUF2382 domain-containing protein [Deinococcus malanensis]GGK18778.1 hypothetical protein GCM10008955_10230 [Deinococcus malanensis]
MARLFPISRSAHDLGGLGSPVGQKAYGMGGSQMGTIREALTDETGRIRYLVVDASSWFVAKEIMVPVGMARITDDAVYFDELTREHAGELSAYGPGQDTVYQNQVADERVLRAVDSPLQTGTAFNYRDEDDTDTLFTAPGRLQLLEERLVVNKDRLVAGSVEIGKQVQTVTQRVEVPLQREEIVIDRHVVRETRPVTGEVQLGDASVILRVELEAERADIGKQAFVTEEVSVGKRTVTDTETFTADVGREVLDVVETGAVGSRQPAGSVHLAQRSVDAIQDAAEPLEGKIDRR